MRGRLRADAQRPIRNFDARKPDRRVRDWDSQLGTCASRSWLRTPATRGCTRVMACFRLRARPVSPQRKAYAWAPRVGPEGSLLRVCIESAMHRVGLGAQRPQEWATCGEVGKACRHGHLTLRSSSCLRRVAACLSCRWCRRSGRSRGRSQQ